MRNLKRALSLGLTAAMISGLMVMGSSAASSSYTDVADTDNVEAIEVLKAVGIMVGDESGDFNPDQNVTRNEMAVIMSNLMAYNVATYKDTSPFTDVPSWAEPYVAACWTNGITAGTSDTTYGGEQDVTTAQAALMVMKALGYFQYASDFGADWQLATVSQGNRIDLFTDVDSGVREAMTRNDVAQLVLNALEAGTVEAESDGSISVGDITIANNVSYKFVTSGRDYAYTINRQLDTNNDGTYSEGAIVELGEKLYQGDLTKEEDVDVFGRPANIWEYQAKEIGTFAEAADTTFTAKVTSKALYDAVGKTATDNYSWYVYVDGERQDYDGRDLSGNKSDDDDDFLTEAAVTPATGVTGNGVITEVYVDGTHRTVHVAVTHYYSAEVYEVDADEGTITLSKFYGPDAMDTNDEYDSTDFAEDDIVMYSFADGEVQDVYAAEQMTGDVSLVRVSTAGGDERDGDLFEADGNTYKYNYTMDSADRLVTENVDNNVVAYLDANGYVAYIDESAMTYDYAYVLSMGIGDDNYDNSTNQYTNGTVYARLVLTDGTMVKAKTDLKVSDASGDVAQLTSGAIVAGHDGKVNLIDVIYEYNNHIVSYSVDSRDEYTLSIKDKDNQTATDEGTVRGTNGTRNAPAPTDLKVENGVANMTAPGRDYTINSNTVFIVADSDTALDDYEFSVYTGVKNVPDIEGQTTGVAPNQKISKVAVAADEDRVAKVVYVEDANVSGAGNVYFAVANHNTKMDHSSTLGYYYRIDAVVDGEVVTLQVKENSTAAQKLVTNITEGYDLDGGGLNNGKALIALDSITYNSDGLVTNVGLYDNESGGDGYVTGSTGTGRSSNETVRLNDQDRSYAWDDEVVVVRYNYKGDLSVSSISSVKNDANDGYLAVLDSNVLIGLIIREVDNVSGGVSPTSSTVTKGDATLTVNQADVTATNVAISDGGVLRYEFSVPTTIANNGDEVAYNYVVTVDGLRVANGTKTGEVLGGIVSGSYTVNGYDAGNDVEIIITGVASNEVEMVTVTFPDSYTGTYNFYAEGSNTALKVNNDPGANSSVQLTEGLALLIDGKTTLTAGDVFYINGKYYAVDSTGVLTIPANDLTDNMVLNIQNTGANQELTNPTAGELLEALASGKATVTGTIPAGDYDANGAELILDTVTISGKVQIAGDFDIKGTLTLDSTAEFNTQEVVIENGEKVAMQNSAKFQFATLVVKTGGQIANTDTNVAVAAAQDITITITGDGTGYLNGTIPFTGGLMGALVAGGNAGLFTLLP